MDKTVYKWGKIEKSTKPKRLADFFRPINYTYEPFIITWNPKTHFLHTQFLKSQIKTLFLLNQIVKDNIWVSYIPKDLIFVVCKFLADIPY